MKILSSPMESYKKIFFSGQPKFFCPLSRGGKGLKALVDCRLKKTIFCGKCASFPHSFPNLSLLIFWSRSLHIHFFIFLSIFLDIFLDSYYTEDCIPYFIMKSEWMIKCDSHICTCCPKNPLILTWKIQIRVFKYLFWICEFWLNFFV